MVRKNRLKLFLAVTILIAVFMISACKNSPEPPDADTVAVYKDGRITRQEFKNEVDKLYEAVEDNAQIIRHLNRPDTYIGFIKNMVLERMVKQKIIAMKLDKRKNFKHVMKHVSEELNLSEMHTRAHDRQIKVSDQEIKKRYEQTRPLLGQATLTEATDQIRTQLQMEKEKHYFKSYIEKLRENAVISRNDELLRVPEPSDVEVRMYYDQNRASYPKQSYEQAYNSIKEILRVKNTERWLRENQNRTLLTIHGKRFTVGEFYEEIEELPENERDRYRSNASMSSLLDKMIDRMLMVEDTYDQMLSSETKNERGHIRDDILRQVLHQEEVDDKIEISEEEIKSYFDKNANAFVKPPRIQINYIRISAGQTEQEEKKAELKVREAYRKLKPGRLRFKKGEEFKKIATEYSEDPETAKKGGSLDGWISENSSIIEEIASHRFHENVLGLGEKDISRPFLFHGSYYIVQVRERQDASPIAFAEAKDAIEAELKAIKHYDLSKQRETNLIEQAELIVFKEVVETILNETNKES